MKFNSFTGTFGFVTEVYVQSEVVAEPCGNVAEAIAEHESALE